MKIYYLKKKFVERRKNINLEDSDRLLLLSGERIVYRIDLHDPER